MRSYRAVDQAPSNTYQCPDPGNAFEDFNTDDNWVLVIENVLRHNAKDAWEDGSFFGGLLLLLFHLLQVCLEGIKEVVDNVGLATSSSKRHQLKSAEKGTKNDRYRHIP